MKTQGGVNPYPPCSLTYSPFINIMSPQPCDYEILLCEYSQRKGAIALLKQYRPYLEMIPSMRRPAHSLITIPLPVVRLRLLKATSESSTQFVRQAVQLPCDVAVLMCDPEWKIKLGSEILIFIHRPQEDFSGLLMRWRKAQVYLERDYEWLMPLQEEHMFSDRPEHIYPLFVVTEKTPLRIKKGLAGACLPFVVQKFGDLSPESRLVVARESET